jgi:hypothetical protein
LDSKLEDIRCWTEWWQPFAECNIFLIYSCIKVCFLGRGARLQIFEICRKLKGFNGFLYDIFYSTAHPFPRVKFLVSLSNFYFTQASALCNSGPAPEMYQNSISAS